MLEKELSRVLDRGTLAPDVDETSVPQIGVAWNGFADSCAGRIGVYTVELQERMPVGDTR